jgi:hypothetical protein
MFEGAGNLITFFILSLVSLYSLYIYLFILSRLDLLYIHCVFRPLWVSRPTVISNFYFLCPENNLGAVLTRLRLPLAP